MKLSKINKKSVRKIFNPIRIIKAVRIQKKSKKNPDRCRNDAQLKFYSSVFCSDYLHYGYFKDVNTDPADISFNDFHQAQVDYALQFVDHIELKDLPILDIGCGMGGLTNLFYEKGFKAYALTPDLHQVDYIKAKCPNIPVIGTKFEEIDSVKYQNYFGTLITSESLQYLHLEHSLDLMNKLLVKEGTWLVCDYFRKGESHEKSGHNWDYFSQTIAKNGWTIISETDITLNVAVTLGYAYEFCKRIGLPLYEFIIGKIKLKQAGFSYLANDLLENIDQNLHSGIEVVKPQRFIDEKKYVFLIIKRTVDCS